jgi:hypothetical protein
LVLVVLVAQDQDQNLEDQMVMELTLILVLHHHLKASQQLVVEEEVLDMEPLLLFKMEQMVDQVVVPVT